MTEAKRLVTEWLWDGDGAPKGFRDFIRSQTREFVVPKKFPKGARLDTSLSSEKSSPCAAGSSTVNLGLNLQFL
ncbi:hypothetical protein [Salinibacterium sp. SWN248]|uniref:hypothetical protein n=1 Tax=Salinibacterium sp. SWN248 TaxID=2792056 RepID=UPI0018CFE2A4|nr:hypothetical protein [Salinibacterium sp. SWN248]MBH0024430.1 hypothetical protein [Salinibacterium sp. SWN248]